ncbi:hypothetical protein BU23DRAFT_555341 [Bimuria novae-zelandiae CBS 107.79]|uniref:Uncharacterized protein n=1 Tax=Bimuria novae-zelandiae CBS 107.79 TaxID=1447943 RepID=A0A6A5V4P2_9PLEO|nr:hypothetical protein BU23DRAFT_555341 [Bimuria novae-zelandiae CBS 107.79]
MASSTATSPFLSLPAELRNIIVAHALTWPTRTLQYNTLASSKHGKPIFEAVPGREFNQLKYTCKQLYAETAGLEVRYNALRFELPEDDAYTLARIQNSVDSGFLPTTLASSSSFPLFLYTCSAAKRKWLREVVVTIRKPASYSLSQPTMDRLLRLARFMQENPGLRVKYEYVDEVYEYKAPAYQAVVQWLSVAVCLGVALPLPVAWEMVAETLWAACGKGSLVFWSLGFGVWDLVGMK